MTEEESVAVSVGDKIGQLLKERSRLQAVFTRKENCVKRLIKYKDSSSDDVDDYMLSLQKTHERIEENVSQVMKLVEDEEEEVIKLRTYLDTMRGRWISLKDEVCLWQQDAVKPEDSASQAGVSATSTSSKLKLAAKKAALQVKVAALKKSQELKLKQLKLEQLQESMHLETDLAAAEAEEKVYEEATKNVEVMSVKEQEVEDMYFGPIGKTETVLLPDSPVPQSEKLQLEMLNLMELPRIELHPFDGNPLKFWTFIRAFDNSVGETSISDSAKLNRLLQFCTDKALAVIECCIIMDPLRGYAEARRLLFDRFGNQFVIAKAWVQKITGGGILKHNDATELRNFSDNVRSCVLTLSAMDTLSEIDNQTKMKQIVGKLPAYLQSKWRTFAVRHLKATSVYPSVNDLAEFIETAAEEMDDPVFGVESVTSSTTEVKRKQFPPKLGLRGNISNFNTNVRVQGDDSRSIRVCRCCAGSHPLYKCGAFLSLSSEKRKEFVMKHRLCFNCFASTHASYNCPKQSLCGKEGCNGKHSNLLHDVSKRSFRSHHGLSNICKPSCSTQTESSASGVLPSSASCGVSGTSGTRIALPIVPVSIKLDGTPDILTYALLDPGSTNTFCTQELAERLKVEGESTKLSINTLTNASFEAETKVMSLTVTDLSGRQMINLSPVFVVPKMPVLKDCIVTQRDIDQWDHFGGIQLPDIQENVSLLIGQDNPLALVPLDVRSGGSGQPYATRTVFGWAINGPLYQDRQHNIVVNCVQIDNSLQTLVQKFWECDSMVEDNLMSASDKSVLKLWDESVEVVKGHYQLPIPFKHEVPNLPNNYAVAESRLESLAKKLSKNCELFERYKAGIKELVDKGYAERVSPEEMHQNAGGTWYLPHHAVISERKPGKLRIVFDCSSKFSQRSLNDVVHQGPDLTNSLIGVLLRFREGSVAISGDIEAMFLQVKVAQQHRDVLRFLWWKENDMSQNLEVFRMTSHLFGGVWSPSCANYALRKTAEDNKSNFKKETISTVNENFYVDDCLKSVETEEQAVDLVDELCKLLQKGGFRLTKFLSNNRKVLESISVDERAKDIKDLDIGSCQLPEEKALGVQWDMNEDELVFKFVTKVKPYTKRGMISVISSLYDPLGFLSPVIVQGKLIFQEECRQNKEWDSPLDKRIADMWSKWLYKLQYIRNFAVPRCVKPKFFDRIVSCQLHNFADASMTAYGAVSYLRFEDEHGRVQCSLVLGKSRLAPMKGMTIPRLELSAALLCAKLHHLLLKEQRLRIDKSILWTDSMIVLYYIKNNSRYQTFVANRVNQIRELSQPEDWHHIESSSNPADDVSRGVDADKMLLNKRWICGPDFLYQSEEAWSESPGNDLQIDTAQLEVKKTTVNLAEIEVSEPDGTTKLIEAYSSWYRLKRAVAWLLRVRANLLQRVKEKASCFMSKHQLTVDELQKAETAVVKYIQKKEFSGDIERLKMGKPVKKSSIFRLDPSLNSDGIMCVGGRLSQAPICDSSKHPIILPKRHHVVNLIVRATHEELGHSGKEHILSHIRQRFWILGGRKVIQKVVNQCFRCRKMHGQASAQKMASLPEDRVTPGKPPFSHIGIDCFGPFFVKRGRGEVKRYGCLFTCLCTRAVHIEKLDNMDTQSFIMAFRRFEARRGKPELVRSDNGSNFRGAQRELGAAIRSWNKQQIQEFMLQKEIHWIFNPPTASHMGGSWERLIRTIRRLLNSLSSLQGLQDDDLSTLFCEVERIINSRPITVVSNCPKDMEALSPNHILLLRPDTPMPPGEFTLHDVYRKRWKHVQFLADQFWKRWLKEYLPCLQTRQKWLKSCRNLAVDDVVLMMDEQVPRNVWPLARVTKTFPGQDGLVRSVEIKTRDSLYTRPIHKLCLLESVADRDEK